MTKRLVLASTSPRRHEVAAQIGLDFEIVPSDYEEDMTMDLPPGELVKELAYGKAKDVADRTENAIVIGMDTIVVIDDKRLGKPKSKDEAFEMLRAASGRTQEVYSGIALIDSDTKETIKDFEVTKVTFNEMTDEEIWHYINTGEPMDKAGAYGIQDLSSIFICGIEGCYFNVVGFPAKKVYDCLKKFGVDIFKHKGWKRRAHAE